MRGVPEGGKNLLPVCWGGGVEAQGSRLGLKYASSGKVVFPTGFAWT